MAKKMRNQNEIQDRAETNTNPRAATNQIPHINWMGWYGSPPSFIPPFALPENIGAYIANCHISTERETRRIRKAATSRLWRQRNKERVRQSKSRWKKQRKTDKQISQHLCLFQKNAIRDLFRRKLPIPG